MTAILNAKKSRQDRETLPISSPIEHDARYFLDDDFKKRQETTNFPQRMSQLHCFGNNRS